MMKEFLDSKVLLWIVQLLVGFVLALCGLILKNTLDRLEVIEKDQHTLLEWRAETKGNRFTSNDALEVWKAIAEVKRDIAIIPSNSPPKWFVDRVDRLEDKINILGEQVKYVNRSSPSLSSPPSLTPLPPP